METANEKSVGTLIGEALRPVREGAMTKKTRSIRDALYDSLREIQADIREARKALDELQAREAEMEEQIARLRGDALVGDWYAARAVAFRDPSPDNVRARHEAFVRWQAAEHLRAKTVPAEDDPYRAEIEAELDRQRGGVRQ